MYWINFSVFSSTSSTGLQIKSSPKQGRIYSLYTTLVIQSPFSSITSHCFGGHVLSFFFDLFYILFK